MVVLTQRVKEGRVFGYLCDDGEEDGDSDDDGEIRGRCAIVATTGRYAGDTRHRRT